METERSRNVLNPGLLLCASGQAEGGTMLSILNDM